MTPTPASLSTSLFLMSLLAALASAAPARAQSAHSFDAGVPPAPVPPAAPPAAPADAGPAPLQVTEVTVVGTREKQTAGSAHILKAEELERLNQDDAHQIVKQVPGVYFRGEDGLGLRPNIGIRGVNPDRSKKIVLMEDGILFGPAPYAAPAAYYFPNMTRMEAVRVIKGPGSVAFGPQTVGGAIDFITRRVPSRLTAGIDLAGGQYRYGKAHGYVGASNRHLGFLLEGVRLQNDGFKQLDGGGDTGFAKNELMGKLRYVPLPGAAVHNELELKLGYSTEESDETYLGLTDADFRANPLRRYGASREDHMSWTRWQLALRHLADFGGGRNITTTIYHHDFDRTWRKINGVAGLDILDVMKNPASARNQLALQALQLQDSPVPIIIGPNNRQFISQGVASVGSCTFGNKDGVAQRVEVGARLHHDRISRVHTEDTFRVEGGELVDTTGPGPETVTADRHESAYALALHVMDAISWRQLTVTPGVRFERIRLRARDRAAGTPAEVEWENALIPGLGAYYALGPVWGVLAGAYRGFSPPPPGSETATSSETSWNYEAGVRAAGARSRAEAIAFFNDYSNLITLCTFASGCTSDMEGMAYNAGEARIWGVELFGQHTFRVPGLRAVSFPLSGNYTYTATRFGSSFNAAPPDLREVYEGDRLPYVPLHQGALTLAMESAHLGLVFSASYMSAFWEQAWGSSKAPEPRPSGPPLKTDASFLMEAGAHVYLLTTARYSAQVYVHLRNITNTHDIAARRPFGARPNAPRWLQAGVKASF
jgi:Fe(3+) dicitrate transport protein